MSCCCGNCGPTCPIAMTTENPPSCVGCNRGGNSTCVSSLVSAVSTMGIGVAGAVTGRPVITTKTGQVTLGNKPTITGQIQASSLLSYGLFAVVAIAIIFVVGRK